MSKVVSVDHFGQAKQTAWHQVEAPRNLVQYDNGNIKMVLNK